MVNKAPQGPHHNGIQGFEKVFSKIPRNAESPRIYILKTSNYRLTHRTSIRKEVAHMRKYYKVKLPAARGIALNELRRAQSIGNKKSPFFHRNLRQLLRIFDSYMEHNNAA